MPGQRSWSQQNPTATEYTSEQAAYTEQTDYTSTVRYRHATEAGSHGSGVAGGNAELHTHRPARRSPFGAPQNQEGNAINPESDHTDWEHGRQDGRNDEEDDQDDFEN